MHPASILSNALKDFTKKRAHIGLCTGRDECQGRAEDTMKDAIAMLLCMVDQGKGAGPLNELW